MKISICFSGQIRTGIECSKNILNFITNESLEIDYFIHTWDIETDRFKQTTINITDDKINEFIKIYKPKKFKISNSNECNYEIPIQSTFLTIPMFRSIYECNKLKQEYEIENKFKYDYVVRIRPDIIYYSFHKLYDEITYISNFNSWVNVNQDITNIIYTCDSWNKLPGAMEDIFWIAKSDTMDIICDNIKNIIYKDSECKSDDGWQVELSNYIYNTLNIYIKPLKYNNLEICRYDSDFSSKDMLKLN